MREESMKRCRLRSKALMYGMLFLLSISVDVHAAGGIETAGDVLVIALPAAAAGLTFGFRDGRGAVEFGKSMALTLGATYGLKWTIDEKRSNGDNQAFPSAHASTSFASAEFVRKRYGWDYGIPAYVIAAFVAYSRVEAEQHYTHDVIAGAAIGIASSYLFTHPYKGWHIQPEAEHRYHGIRLTRTW